MDRDGWSHRRPKHPAPKPLVYEANRPRRWAKRVRVARHVRPLFRQGHSARLAAQYGGKVENWTKMAADEGRTLVSGVVAGIKGQVHWYENVLTGAKVEGKFKID